MILIADSGSTKTAWCLIEKTGESLHFESIGMNPYNISKEQFAHEMEKIVIPNLKGKVVEILHFYGSGCSAEAKKHEMALAMRDYFPNTSIEIEHDLLAACRALCGNQAGIAAILGTGSSSCLFDGEKILEYVPALGYVLCDEGAGSQIGKALLIAYLRNEFPNELHEKFHGQFPQSETAFLDALYKESFPNRFLASFSPFALENREHPYMQVLLTKVFELFFENQILKYTNYTNYELGILGSVGFFFENTIREIASQYDVRIGKVIQNPLNELAKYHSGNRL